MGQACPRGLVRIWWDVSAWVREFNFIGIASCIGIRMYLLRSSRIDVPARDRLLVEYAFLEGDREGVHGIE